MTDTPRAGGEVMPDNIDGPAMTPEWLAPPADTPKYMLQAWFGALHHALGDHGIVAAFRADTGNQWMPGRAPIERMIDKATGAEERFLRDFVIWFNANVWGPMDEGDDA